MNTYTKILVVLVILIAMAIGAVVGTMRQAPDSSDPKLFDSEDSSGSEQFVKGEDENPSVPTKEEPQESEREKTPPKPSIPTAIEKTRTLLEKLKVFIEGDARRAAFLCSGDPCRVQTLVLKENNFHLDCAGNTLAPAEGQKVGMIIKASEVIIENCAFDGFDTAIEIKGDNAILYKNTIRGSEGNGINIGGQKATILDNVIESNKGIGIFVAGESNEHAIADNIVRNNGTQGLHIFGAGGITVDQNTITGNKSEGIWLSGNARDNLIYENTIQENGGECTIFLSKIGEVEPQDNIIVSNKVDKSITTCK